ncbi:serine hydrolase [Sphingomicrobium astaxanthinifaciens]|uniref:serine hydrolase n=1 Tax=Sphingomicrobium astaxanthinifaciens TaxID=1227949 RepID=UPI001FCC7BFE|nr:serine hydrolase [Sphingomicrobium astaxanthinifaciens]MCJ7421215.1 class A beta-lactamase-related serine hydrolase [Sphingomicrobium astaxanthinifaciens]
MATWVGKLLLGGAMVVSSVASAQLVAENRAQAVPERAPLEIDLDAAENDRGVAARPPLSDAFTVTIPPRPAVVNPPHVAELNARIHDRVRSFSGTSGLAIKAIDAGWEAGWQVERSFPQQSVSKLWVTLTVLDQVDRGRLSLGQTLRFDRDDVTLWSSSTAAQILKGGYSRSLDGLIFDALTKSDNHANDKMLRLVGGPEAVRQMVRDKALGDIGFGDGEREMQAKIAGLSWRQSYAYDNGFNRARAAVPGAQRRAAFDRYLESPYDGASPIAIARALARLERGELLSPASTAKMLTTMGMTRTGRLRVRGGLAPGWEWSHKTGTGQTLGRQRGGLNDVGILTAPDGTSYALAFMTIPDPDDGSAQELMRDVTRMVIEHHERYALGDLASR